MGLLTGFTFSASAFCEARGGTWDAARRACVTKEEAQAAAVKAWEAYIPQFQRTLSDETLLHMDNVAANTVPEIERRIFDHFKWVRDKYANPAGRYDQAVAVYDAGVRNLRLAMQAVRDSAEAGVTDPQVCNLLRGWDWKNATCVNRAAEAAALVQAQAEATQAQAEADLATATVAASRSGFDIKSLLIPGLGLLAILALMKLKKRT